MIAGRVLDLRDVIVFEGGDVGRSDHGSSTKQWTIISRGCEETGMSRKSPYSGKLPFRTTPEHHRKIALAAARTGKSINAWMDEVVTQAADATLGDHARNAEHVT